METAVAMAGGALAGAAAAGLVLGQQVAEAVERARRAQALVGSRGSGMVPWLLRNGVAPLRPFARALLRSTRLRRMAQDAESLLDGRGMLVSAESLGSVGRGLCGGGGRGAGVGGGGCP